MKISDVMSNDVQLVSPDDTIMRAARMMADIDVGILPVQENDRMIGVITDRDIAIRAVAEGRFEAKVRDIMSPQVLYVFDDQDVDEVAENMAEQQVRRFPVVNREKRLVGIISLADIALSGEPLQTDEALSGISRPGGEHSQTKGASTTDGKEET